MTIEQRDSLFANIKLLIEKHNETRETLKDLVVAIEWKMDGDKTVRGWEKRRAEALYNTGLGPKPMHIYLKERKNDQSK